MSIFDMHRAVIDDYRQYVQSFISIADPEIRTFVERELADGQRLWPEPLIQLNPEYQAAGTVDDLASSGLLLSATASIFRHDNGAPLRLFQHQHDAITKANQKQSYVVTSGTGSGKSLAYFIPIFDAILRNNPQQSKVRAIVIYPMNALVNSQFEALDRFANSYKERNGREMPVRFGKYTGQQDDTMKHDMQDRPPHILLTNFMMLEMMLLRGKESVFVDRDNSSIEFLILDELHTYRGRQGSDVALLIRRLRERCGNPGIIHIGTSATMASGKKVLPLGRRKAVSDFATSLFGAEIRAENVIEETLVPITSCTLEASQLKRAVLDPAPVSKDRFLASPLTGWIEECIGLEKDTEDRYVRRTPQTLSSVAQKLSEVTSLDPAQCFAKLQEFLLIQFEDKKPVLKFKLHQFISQGQPISATVEQDGREFSLDGQCYKPGRNPNDADRQLLALTFCRNCGQEYYKAQYDEDRGRLRPWGFETDSNSDGAQRTRLGYLYLQPKNTASWSLADLPPEFCDGRGRPKSTHKHRVPKLLYVHADGTVAEDPAPGAIKAWYQPKPFLICQSCGEYHYGRGDDFRKLGELSNGGRSSATTTLAVSVLAHAAEAGIAEIGRKLLSFTDNRQDASLQSGHFNDFAQVCLLRAAIVNALDRNAELRHDNIAAETVKSLGLRFADFSRSEQDENSPQASRIRKAFRELIEYRIYEDLRRGWRIIHPNLEQCSLLQIRYNGLDEACRRDDLWSDLPGLRDWSAQERLEAIKPILDFARRKLAIRNNWLNDTFLAQMRKRVNQDICDRWCFDDSEENLKPAARFALAGAKVVGPHSLSLGPQSLVGRYLKRTFPIERDYEGFVEKLSRVLASQGLLNLFQEKAATFAQIDASVLIWTKGEGRPQPPDPIYSRRMDTTVYKSVDRETNQYFTTLYRERASLLSNALAAEHTAQIGYSDREQREQDFRAGKLRAMFCSPTMELGIDIGDLQLVHMRSVPPTPANYTQRSGRAGRQGDPALIITYCGALSGHDHYYFNRREEMVAGVVHPPRVDLRNEDLVRAHVHAIWFAKVKLNIGRSVAEILDLSKSAYPLNDEIRNQIQLSPAQIVNCAAEVQRVISLCDVSQADWYFEGWIDAVLAEVPKAFDSCFNRWRGLYRSALAQLKKYQELEASSFEEAVQREARYRINEANRQRNLLVNESTSHRESDFYPYRYLASEGFLPGFNFPRLPIRVYIPRDKGEFINRQRFLAISEFGPDNFIYHQGAKFQVRSLLAPPGGLEERQVRAKLCNICGCYNPESNDLCQNCHTQSSGTDLPLVNLLDMPDARTIRRSRITCDEEERLRRGYELSTHFEFGRLDGSSRIRCAVIGPDPDQPLLQATYAPSATLYRVNHGWKVKTEGFQINLKTGEIVSEKADGSGEEASTVRLVTHDTQNILLVTPPAQIQDNPEALASFQYALQRGMEISFQIEESELASEQVGKGDHASILYWEAAEGGAGVLRRLVEEANTFRQVAEKALEALHFNVETGDDEANPEKCLHACYECLLSYRNQLSHPLLKRQLVVDVLCSLRSSKATLQHDGRDYNAQYEYLRNLTDTRSPLERRFLKHLYETRRELPDEIQKALKDVNTIPDSYFSGTRACIYCDGSVHDSEPQRLKDEQLRKQLHEQGYRVVVIRYDRDLEEQIQESADVFGEKGTEQPVRDPEFAEV
jgi:DEAD/DEAH box helicase/Helicase conserved C-terminal domain/Domain of unknown function (DUF1998)